MFFPNDDQRLTKALDLLFYNPKDATVKMLLIFRFVSRSIYTRIPHASHRK